MNSVCLENIDWENRVYLAIGLFIYGCKPILSNCPSVVKINRDKVVVETSGLEIEICTSGFGDCTIVLNIEQNGLYQHLIKTNSFKQYYVTNERIDPFIFTGMFLCSLIRGLDTARAFDEVLRTISITSGNLHKLFQNIYSEYVCFNRLLSGLNTLSNSVLTKVFSNKILLIGCRFSEEYLYLSTIHITKHGLIHDLSKVVISEKSEYSVFPLGKCFMCIDELDTSVFEKHGYSITSYSRYKCVLSDELENTIALLENIYS